MDFRLEKTVGQWAYRASSAALLLAVALFVWRRNRIITFGNEIPVLKPSDALIALSFVFMVFAIATWSELRRNVVSLAVVWQWGRWLAVLVGFFILGSLWKFYVQGSGFMFAEFAEYGRIGIGIVAFFLLLIIGSLNDAYRRWIGYAFFSSILLSVFIFVAPAVILYFHLVVSPAGYAFVGFHSDTAALANFLTVPIGLLFGTFLVKSAKSPWGYAYGVPLLLVTGVLLWTRARAGWIAVLFGMTVATIFLMAESKKHAGHMFLRGLLGVCAAFVGGFLVLSPLLRNVVIATIYPNVVLSDVITREVENALQEEYAPPDFLAVRGQLFRVLPTLEYLRLVDWESPRLDFRESRLDLWSAYAQRLPVAPFGLGPLYNTLKAKDGSVSHPLRGTAHSALLQVTMSGGIGALAILMVMVWNAANSLFFSLRRKLDAYTLGLVTAFSAMLVDAFFIDALTLRWVWIVMALVVLEGENRTR